VPLCVIPGSCSFTDSSLASSGKRLAEDFDNPRDVSSVRDTHPALLAIFHPGTSIASELALARWGCQLCLWLAPLFLRELNLAYRGVKRSR
jgi:hypothetical protein